MVIKKTKVCVIGLGYIGLPTACVLADAGYQVLGMDIDNAVIARIQAEKQIITEPLLTDLLTKAIKNGNLILSTKLSSADVFIITVPTPIDPHNQPDMSAVDVAIGSILEHVTAKNLVIIESTCAIGTTDLMTKKLRCINEKIYVAYCPERVIPGNIINELLHNNRIVGGIDEASTLYAVNFYKSFVQGEVLAATSTKIAEAVKLVENSYRDLNIAFANELSMMADYINLDINELISLANKHPRVNVLSPGVGVGGHCLAVDPYFLTSLTPKYTKLIACARNINNAKTKWILQKIKKVIVDNNIKVATCLGLTYKANTSDLRNSPALHIVEELKKEIQVNCVDLFVPNTKTLEEAIITSELVISLVAHDAFFNIQPELLANQIILDFAGIFK
jgi:UDP-N-acetyl-D-mannosaminuronic acid dehydrogenase